MKVNIKRTHDGGLPILTYVIIVIVYCGLVLEALQHYR